MIRLASVYFAVALLEFVFAAALVVWVRRRTRVDWRVVLAGALVFLLFQVLTRVPLVTVLQAMLVPRLTPGGRFWWGWIGLLALSAGVFEEVGRWVGYTRFIPRAPRTWKTGVAFGTGHAAAEVVLLVAPLTFATAVNVVVISYLDVLRLPLSPEQLQQLEAARALFAQIAWWVPLLGLVERAFTFPVHVALSLLVLRGVREHNLAWVGLAVGFHAAVNLAGVAVQQFYGPVAAEVIIGLFAVLATGWILASRRAERL